MFQELGELGLLYYNCLFVCLPTMLIALVMGEYQTVIFAFLLFFPQLPGVLFTHSKSVPLFEKTSSFDTVSV